MNSRYLNFFAGDRAFEQIKEKGLAPDDVKIMAGAAGGPKWLVMGHLDRMLFTEWFKGRTEPLFTVGSSSGAWRFASAAQNDPVAGIDRFEEAYIHQFYEGNPTPAEITAEGRRIQAAILGEKGASEILSHPFLRLNVMAVLCRGPLLKKDAQALQGLGFATAILFNAVFRKALGLFFKRVLFYDPRDLPPYFQMKDFPPVQIPLSEENLVPALLASGAIPLIMCGIDSIPHAPAGVYRDGGIIDYHMDIPFGLSHGIVLFPHYMDRIIPGWLDKKLFWRNPVNADRTLMVSPSQEFLELLPDRKIPDRNDFWAYQDRDMERVAAWKEVVERSRMLAEEFMETVSSGRIRERIKPLPA